MTRQLRDEYGISVLCSGLVLAGSGDLRQDKLYVLVDVRHSDIEGLTPLQIQEKYALPTLPTHYCYVDVPPGTEMYIGIANEVSGWGAGGGMQFETKDLLPDGYFGDGILIS